MTPLIGPPTPHPLPTIPDGIPLTAYAFYGVHGSLWAFLWDPTGNIKAWRNPGRDDYYHTLDQLNAAHGPLRWDGTPYPVENRAATAYTRDGLAWTYAVGRVNNLGGTGGWVQTITPQPDESDDCLTWNWLHYTRGITS